MAFLAATLPLPFSNLTLLYIFPNLCVTPNPFCQPMVLLFQLLSFFVSTIGLSSALGHDDSSGDTGMVVVMVTMMVVTVWWGWWCGYGGNCDVGAVMVATVMMFVMVWRWWWRCWWWCWQWWCISKLFQHRIRGVNLVDQARKSPNSFLVDFCGYHLPTMGWRNVQIV